MSGDEVFWSLDMRKGQLLNFGEAGNQRYEREQRINKSGEVEQEVTKQSTSRAGGDSSNAHRGGGYFPGGGSPSSGAPFPETENDQGAPVSFPASVYSNQMKESEDKVLKATSRPKTTTDHKSKVQKRGETDTKTSHLFFLYSDWALS